MWSKIQKVILIHDGDDTLFPGVNCHANHSEALSSGYVTRTMGKAPADIAAPILQAVQEAMVVSAGFSI